MVLLLHSAAAVVGVCKHFLLMLRGGRRKERKSNYAKNDFLIEPAAALAVPD